MDTEIPLDSMAVIPTGERGSGDEYFQGCDSVEVTLGSRYLNFRYLVLPAKPPQETVTS